MIVVSDSSSLIAIAAVGHLDLLRRMYGEVIVPPAVWSEVSQPNRPGAGDLVVAEWIRVVPPSNPVAIGFPSPVGPGEAEAIALAIELAADVVLIELGLLLEAKKDGASPSSSRFSTRWNWWGHSGSNARFTRRCFGPRESRKQAHVRLTVDCDLPL